MNPDALLNAHVRLSSPDGRTFDFAVADMIEHAGETYVILSRMGAPDELVITQVEQDEASTPLFVMVEDEGVIERVLEIRMARHIKNTLDKSGLCDTPRA